MSSFGSTTSAVIGGIPTKSVDVPICAVFLAIYLTSLSLNLTIFIRNQRRHHKFFIQWLLCVFSIIRLITCSMRIAWALHPTNSSLAIASQVFNNAGVIFIYIINMIFAQRILRAKQPRWGWNKPFRTIFKILCGLIIGALIMGITGLIISINTTNPQTLQSIRDVSLASATYTMTLAVFPLAMLAVAFFCPPSASQETFGTGTITKKTLILLVSTCLAIIIAGYRTGTTWESPRPVSNPAWYQSKAAYYCFGFVLEIMILATFIIFRVDNMFHVPDKCKGPGDYTRLNPDKEMSNRSQV